MKSHVNELFTTGNEYAIKLNATLIMEGKGKKKKKDILTFSVVFFVM